MKPARIALFAPSSPYYTDVMFGFGRGFQALGVEVYVGGSLLDPDVLERFCHHYQPSVVLELNRSRTQLPSLPKDVIHISWLQDYVDGLLERPSLSEITYFFIDPGSLGYKHGTGLYQSVLLPGCDPSVYSYSEEAFVSDFSFIGYIPPPVNKLLPLHENLACNPFTGARVTNAEAIEVFLRRYTWGQGTLDYHQINELVFTIAREFTGIACESQINDNTLRVFNEQLIRLMERKQLIDTALSLSKSIRIFGSKTWAMWPQYAKYYCGYLFEQSKMKQAYQTTKLNLHNNNHGASMHTRVLDCMASGGCILINRSPQDFLPGGIRNFFEPDLHYVSYDFENLSEVAGAYLSQTEHRRKIGMEASREVLSNHTWKHRAQQVLDDLIQF